MALNDLLKKYADPEAKVASIRLIVISLYAKPSTIELRATPVKKVGTKVSKGIYKLYFFIYLSSLSVHFIAAIAIAVDIYLTLELVLT